MKRYMIYMRYLVFIVLVAVMMTSQQDIKLDPFNRLRKA